MAKSNRERVAEILDSARDGLAPFVIQQYKSRYRGRYLQEMELTLYQQGAPGKRLVDEASALNNLDLAALLNLMERRWKEAFSDKLGRSERTYLNELRDRRNDLAHASRGSAFTNDQARRTAETAKLLLEAVGAVQAAQFCDRHFRELLRSRYERDARNVVKRPPRLDEAPSTTKAGLTRWKEIIQPHHDVSSGRFVQAEFAANLSDVLRGTAPPEYGDAREFFRRTFMTAGLRDLVVNGVKRLSGAGGDPVVQLQTNFGGGKTHSMLALYHAAGEGIRLNELPDYDDMRGQLGDSMDDDLKARRAVIVGTSFDVSNPRQHADCTTRTIWGEIAYQLGGAEAYALIERNDLEATNPGSETLLALLEEHGPALIVIDELVRLTQTVYKVTQVPAAGSFDTILAFVQSLTEAVARASDALLLVSIPQSEIEIGGEGGRVTLAELQQTIGRVESVWKPVSETESYEIVRRRLFGEISAADYPARDAVVNAFYDMYRSAKSDYPAACVDGNYLQLMKDAYPVHPELFERLYRDWSTIDKFQRTRGVLRFMATVIHRLWNDDDKSLLIMPGSIPLFDSDVAGELVKYLPGNYGVIVDSDVDGLRSQPYQIDSQVTALGKYSAARRVARAVFMGSAPSVGEQANRGIAESSAMLATAQPGESRATFADALNRMTKRLSYLYSDGTRYWYDTRPNLNRTAEDRAQQLQAHQIRDEALRRLQQQQWERSWFGRVHLAPVTSSEVGDDDSARLVVLPPGQTHRRSQQDSRALQAASHILETRGSSPRYNKNMLLFLAPDDSEWQTLQRSLRNFLAWQSIQNEAEELNLDPRQNREVKTALDAHDKTANTQLHSCYRWLITPSQDAAEAAPALSAQSVTGGAPCIQRVYRSLSSDNEIIYELSPDYFLAEMPDFLWQHVDHLDLKKLWGDLCQYRYLPRLANRAVLESCLVAGVNRTDPAFAHATGYDQDRSRYTGLKLGQTPTLFFDGMDCLVKLDVALAQLKRERKPDPVFPDPDPIIGPDPVIDTDPGPEPPRPPKPKTRYWAQVDIKPERLLADIDQIDNEVLEHLRSGNHARLKVSLYIEADSREGFDDVAVRTVNENSNTLGFSEHGFED